MCVKAFVSTMLIGMMMVCGLDLLSPINSAEARDYYTRKRVNGVWITGHFQRKRALQPEKLQSDASAAPENSGPQPSTTGALATEEDRPPPFERAVATRNAIIVPEFHDPSPAEPHLLPLRRALEARAKIMAAPGASDAISDRAIRVMTLDYERRIRTILFVDGTRAEEPFDPAATGR